MLSNVCVVATVSALPAEAVAIIGYTGLHEGLRLEICINKLKYIVQIVAINDHQPSIAPGQSGSVTASFTTGSRPSVGVGDQIFLSRGGHLLGEGVVTGVIDPTGH